ncbi:MULTISPECIES: hypothetical protein [unclassified Endozoicomonas]|uniref:hypothetical protein n=1 Tax=unclassified Endozoicomonas TaxID=2644528 RepID=UPI003BB4DB9B
MIKGAFDEMSSLGTSYCQGSLMNVDCYRERSFAKAEKTILEVGDFSIAPGLNFAARLLAAIFK